MSTVKDTLNDLIFAKCTHVGMLYVSNDNLHYHALVQLYAYFSNEWKLFVYIMSYGLPFQNTFLMD